LDNTLESTCTALRAALAAQSVLPVDLERFRYQGASGRKTRDSGAYSPPRQAAPPAVWDKHRWVGRAESPGIRDLKAA